MHELIQFPNEIENEFFAERYKLHRADEVSVECSGIAKQKWHFKLLRTPEITHERGATGEELRKIKWTKNINLSFASFARSDVSVFQFPMHCNRRDDSSSAPSLLTPLHFDTRFRCWQRNIVQIHRRLDFSVIAYASHRRTELDVKLLCSARRSVQHSRSMYSLVSTEYL